MKRRNTKDITEQEWQEIINYAKATTISAAATKYNVYNDTIKYKMDPEYRDRIKQKKRQVYVEKMNNPEEKEKIQKQRKAYAKKNKEKISNYLKQYTADNYDKLKAYSKEHYHENREQIRCKTLQKYAELKLDTEAYEQYRQKQAEIRNKLRTREFKDAYNAKRRAEYNAMPVRRAAAFIYATIGRALTYVNKQNKEGHSVEYLGCTTNEFIKYITSLLQPGMTWENYGEWQIDHIIPISWIREDRDIEPQLKAICNYKNCRPMWAKDNNAKKDKMVFEFSFSVDELNYDFNRALIKPGNYESRCDFTKFILHFQPHFYAKENIIMFNKQIRQEIITVREAITGKQYYEMTPYELYKGVINSGNSNGYSHFSPLWFKKFIEDYNIKTCYDPCGGWGHRLLGAQSLDKYIYNDAWDLTYNGVNEMIKFYNIKNTVTYNNDAATFTPQEEYEALFTCPPYYNLEIYDHKNIFASEDAFKQWWEQTLQHAIKPSVRVIGIVSDQYTHDLLNGITSKFLPFIKQLTVGIATARYKKQYLTIYTK